MQSRITSFSTKPKDKDANDVIDFFKNYSIQTGIKFSFIVISALKNYKEALPTNREREVSNGQK